MSHFNPILIRYIAIFIAISLSNLAWSQGTVSVISSNHPVDPSRYDEIKGSPYLYQEWHIGKIIGSDGKIYEGIEINYNGLTHELESKKDGVVSQINSISYIKVIVETENGNDSFLRGIHPEFGANIVCVSYDGRQVKLLKRFVVRKSANEVQTPMNPTVFEKFVASSEYFLMVEGDLTAVKLKKKKIIEVLGHKTEIEKYLKEEKISLNSESSVIQLLNYYETLI